ncbi:MAG: hypothetical protein BMS9Abin36_0818 [Gammaproteobacteria bacterium]|nr:MAG: hypothetical protein BMS9Abin36_0818 [Gammaproteobacteria bacterium]
MGPEQAMWSWGGMWIFPLIFLAVIIFAVFRFSGRSHSGPPGPGSSRRHGEDSESAVDILNKRYAKGEISKDEFEQMKKELMA